MIEQEDSEESAKNEGEGESFERDFPSFANKMRAQRAPILKIPLGHAARRSQQDEILKRQQQRELQLKVLAEIKSQYSLSSSAVLVDAANTIYDSFVENLKNDPIEDEYTLPSNYQTAQTLAELLSAKFNVSVSVLDTDVDFDSDDSIRKSIQEEMYFISAESPEETAKISEHLIRFQQLKFRLMIDAATTKRVEQSTSNNLALSKNINEIRDELLANNPNKKPALSRIAEILNERGVVSPRGKESKWYAETVKRILERSPKDPNDSPKTGHQK